MVASAGDVFKSKKQDFDLGLIAGADFKFYFTDHLGLVLSGRYVMDIDKKTIDVYGNQIPEYKLDRKTIYGGLGLEWKII